MDLLALFAITVIGVACFLLLFGGFWMAPWLMVVILVGLLLALFRVPLFTQDEPLPTDDQDLKLDANQAVSVSKPLVKSPKPTPPVAEAGAVMVNSAPVDASLATEQKALSYWGPRYKQNTQTVVVASTSLVELEGQYRGNRSKLYAVKEKME